MKLPPNQIMIDLETLDTKPSAIVLAIGACRFDPSRLDDPIVDKFYRVLSANDQEENERTASESTIEWWTQQSDEARKVLIESTEMEADGVHESLIAFADWIGKGAWVWGNGSDFDNVILSSLYNTYEFKQPWSHRNNRCYRTLKALGPLGVMPIDRQGVWHHALDDAVYQARFASALLRAM